MARIIGIISGKGGTGKTVVTINLADAIYKYYKKKVLIVDCNITTPHIGLYLGLYSTPVSLIDVLLGTEPVEKAIYKDVHGFDILPAPLKLTDLKNVNWELLNEKISALNDNYEYILLDSSPGLNRESLITLSSCNESLFVTNPIVYSVADLIKCKDVCKEKNINTLGVILNMVHKKKYEMKRDEIYTMLGINTIFSIPYTDDIPTSLIKKIPAVEFSPHLLNKFKSIAKLIVEKEYEDKEDVISRIFRWLK